MVIGDAAPRPEDTLLDLAAGGGNDGPMLAWIFQPG